MEPLITVVIPTYNREKTIKYCVDSVISQTYSNIEIIIVDDCSIDNTYTVAKGMNDNRLRVIQLEENAGAQAARNRGIIEAKGEWIAFLDSDDIWRSDKLEMQIAVLKNVEFNSYTVVHSNCKCLDEANGSEWIWNVPLTEGDCYGELLSRPGPLFPTFLTSKKALFDIGLLDDKVPSYQEWDTAIRLSKVCSFVHIDAPLFTYILHEGETISKNKNRDIEGYWYVVSKHKNDMMLVNVFRRHIKELISKSISYGFLDQARDFSEMISLSIPFKILFYLIYTEKLTINKITNKLLRKLL